MNDAERVGVEQLQEHASQYVALAKAGRRVPVTEDGKLVACLVPADQPVSVFDQLVAAGKVQRATRKGIADLLPIPPRRRARSRCRRRCRRCATRNGIDLSRHVGVPQDGAG